MYVNPFQVSLETLIAGAPMLGHPLEERARIREAQDRSLVRMLQAVSTVPLRHPAQNDLFCVAPLDILVSETNGEKQFHLIEINGTGIGGLTNISAEAVSCVLDSLSQMAQNLVETDPLVLVAVSGKESEQSPRLNRLLHEKILYLEALKRGFEARGQSPSLTTMAQLVKEGTTLPESRPVVILGYMKEFLSSLRLGKDGKLSLFGRHVTAAVNDRFCLNILQQFGPDIDLRRFWTMNRCFHAGGDKGVAYALLNEFLPGHAGRFFPVRVAFAQAPNREVLIRTVLAWVRRGRKAVIKPQGTGLGHGIEFFLDPNEPEDKISERIDGSLGLTEQFYRVPGGAFPYTVCEFIDTCTIPRPEHPLFGHKYELRIVVYRDRCTLKAFPSIVKISSQAYDPEKRDPLSLINNITASAVAKKTAGTEFMLPLANRATLELLDLKVEHLKELCAFATRFIRHVVDKVYQEPEWFGLPENPEPLEEVVLTAKAA